MPWRRCGNSAAATSSSPRRAPHYGPISQRPSGDSTLGNCPRPTGDRFPGVPAEHPRPAPSAEGRRRAPAVSAPQSAAPSYSSRMTLHYRGPSSKCYCCLTASDVQSVRVDGAQPGAMHEGAFRLARNIADFGRPMADCCRAHLSERRLPLLFGIHQRRNGSR